MLNTIHNLHFYQTIMAEMRDAIEAGGLVHGQRALRTTERPSNDRIRGLIFRFREFTPSD